MTYTQKMNILKLITGVVIITTTIATFALIGYANPKYEPINTQDRIEKFQKEQQEMEKKSPEVSKETVTEIIIVEYILDCNPKLDKDCAERFAERIIHNAKRDHYSPFIQTTLIGSESDFHPKVKHLLKCDKGMTGTNIKVWADDLKKVGIIKTVKDLEDPIVSIDASSYIIKYYMSQYHGKTFNAIAGYKGYCKKGKENARVVVDAAVKLKQKTFRV